MPRTETAVETGFTLNWEERKPPKKFDFANGVQLVGVLTSHERTSVRDKRTGAPKMVNRYVVEERDANLQLVDSVFFHGTVQLDSMLRPADVGHFVSITCTGEDKDAGRAGNAMKLFAVQVSKQPAPGWTANGAVTDDDLPEGF